MNDSLNNMPPLVVISLGGKGGGGKTTIMNGLAYYYQSPQVPAKTSAEMVTRQGGISTVHSFGRVRHKLSGSERLVFSTPHVASTTAGAPTRSGQDIDSSKPL